MASEEERRDLLHFVVVGGGATSCEFATELSEFLEKDVRKWYPDLADLVSLSIVEAGPNLLAGFDEKCWQYYTEAPAGAQRRRADGLCHHGGRSG